MNVACPRKVVPVVNSVIAGVQMEMAEWEQLSSKTAREQVGRAFRLQDAVSK